MVGIVFDRPVGPHGDAIELEYISALLQTQEEELRADGTLLAIDIKHYLKSRHSVNVSEEQIRELIVQELCGGRSSGDDNEKIDIVELVGVLLIPYLVYLKESSVGPSNIDKIFTLLLNEARYLDPTSVRNSTIELTPTLLRSILENYGETEMPESVIHQMIQATGSPRRNVSKDGMSATLDRDAWIKSLTKDVSLYNLAWEVSETLHYDDARALKVEGQEELDRIARETWERRKKRKLNREEGNDDDGANTEVGGGDDDDDQIAMEEAPDTNEKDEDGLDASLSSEISRESQRYVEDSGLSDARNKDLVFQLVRGGNFLDTTADTYYNMLWNVLLWFFIIVSYFAYCWDKLSNVTFNCEEEQIGCKIGHGVMDWLWVFTQLSTLGFGTMLLGSFGNDTHAPVAMGEKIRATFFTMLGLGCMTTVCVLPFVFDNAESRFFETKKNESEYKIIYYFALVLGCLIMVFQVCRIIIVWVPAIQIPFVTDLAPRYEKFLKLSAAVKVNAMVEHALVMHYEPENMKKKKKKKHRLSNFDRAVVELYEEGGTSYNSKGLAQAFLNYESVRDIKEEVGGIMWTWTRFQEGTLFDEDGIWLSSRLITTNLAQAFIILFLAVLYVLIIRELEEIYDDYITGGLSDLDKVAMDYADHAIDFSFISNDDPSFFVGLFELYKHMNNTTNATAAAVLASAAAAAATTTIAPSSNASSFTNSSNDDVVVLNMTTTDSIVNFSTFVETMLQLNENATDALERYLDHHDIDVDDIDDMNDAELYLFFQFETSEVFPRIYDRNDDNEGHNNAQMPNLMASFQLFNDFGAYNTYFMDPERLNVFLNSSEGSVFINSSNGEVAFTTGTFFYNETGDFFYYDWDYAADNDWLPKRWEAYTAFIAGGAVALGATAGLVVVLIPSYVSTTLKYRTGVYGSLKEREFLVYRQKLDKATGILGTAFWGAFFTGWVTLIITVPIVFVLVWEYSRNIIFSIVSQVIGLVVLIIVKFVFMLGLRKVYSVAFFRTRPAIMNLVNTILEIWTISLAVGLMLVRSVILIFIPAFYIGRVDTPLFAPGVGNIAELNIDIAPITFRKDLLQHEAHRHPLIERLGLMFLMKLRHGDEFGSVAGSYWRLLFVMALMPWMRKYRHHRDDSGDDDEEGEDGEKRNVDGRGGGDDDDKKKDAEKEAQLHKDKELELLRKQNQTLLISAAKLTAEVEKLNKLLEKDKKMEEKENNRKGKRGRNKKGPKGKRGKSLTKDNSGHEDQDEAQNKEEDDEDKTKEEEKEEAG